MWIGGEKLESSLLYREVVAVRMWTSYSSDFLDGALSILRILQLRKTMADTVMKGEEEIKIGVDILPYKVFTVELGSTGNAKRVYNKIYRICAANVAEDKKKEKDSDSGRKSRAITSMVIDSQRRLNHAALNPELDKFCTKVKQAHI